MPSYQPLSLDSRDTSMLLLLPLLQTFPKL
jgi:hypothetical protein